MHNLRCSSVKKRLKANFIDIFIENIPITFVENISKINPIIPYYHLVSDEKEIHICHLHPYKNKSQFISDIDFLCNRYQPIGLGDLIEHVKHNKKLKKRSFLLTFDDGYSQMYSVVAPILFKKGIPAIFFLSTDFIDNKKLSYRNKASIIIEFIINNLENISIKQKLIPILKVPIDEMPQVILSIKYKEAKVLDEIAYLFGIRFDDYLINRKPYLSSIQIFKMIEMGFYFGAHSMDHPPYSELSLKEQLDQTIGSLKLIKNSFHLPYSLFAFPYNDLNVNNIFFRTIGNYTDLTFGTGRIKTESLASNLRRINLEKTLKPARKILVRQIIKERMYPWFSRSGFLRT